MALKNFQMNTILSTYDNRRLQSKYELDRRKEKVYAIIPQLKEIDEEIIHDSITSAKLSLSGNLTALEQLKKKNETRIQKKKDLLLAYGFSTDYLEPHYHCDICKDTGYVNSEKCVCFKQAIVDLLYAQSNIQSIIQQENFSCFSYEYYDDSIIDPTLHCTARENIKHVVSEIKKFITQFNNTYQNLLLYGNTGVGKTFLSNCIAKELLDLSHTVIYLTAFQLFEILEKYKFNSFDENKDEIQSKFQYIYTCDLLIIDDIGTELNNTFITSQFYQCINERHLKQKSTIISTNLSFEQFKNNYSERIFSRISSNYTLLKIIGEDIRLQKLLQKQ